MFEPLYRNETARRGGGLCGRMRYSIVGRVLVSAVERPGRPSRFSSLNGLHQIEWSMCIPHLLCRWSLLFTFAVTKIKAPREVLSGSYGTQKWRNSNDIVFCVNTRTITHGTGSLTRFDQFRDA